MKAIVIQGKLELVETELPTPVPEPDQVRLRMAYGGICGSDLHYYNEGANGAYVVREPLVPGHELSGTVDLDPSGELAPGYAGDHPPGHLRHPGAGDRGSPAPLAGRRLPRQCLHLAAHPGRDERVRRRGQEHGPRPARDAAAPPRRAGRAAGRRRCTPSHIAGGVKAKRVLVSGSGAIGLLTAAGALAPRRDRSGVDRRPPGSAAAGPGARRPRHDPGRHQEIPSAYFDVVLECTGVPAAITAALDAARRAGIVVLVGIPPNEPRGVNLSPLVSRELQLRGTLRFNDEIDQAVRAPGRRPAARAGHHPRVPGRPGRRGLRHRQRLRHLRQGPRSPSGLP